MIVRYILLLAILVLPTVLMLVMLTGYTVWMLKGPGVTWLTGTIWAIMFVMFLDTAPGGTGVNA